MAITIQPHIASADDMLRRINRPVETRRFPFPAVIEKRDVVCGDCGRSYKDTRRKICICGQYIDAR